MPKPRPDIAAAVGNTCEPRLKSHRVRGREREAGRDCSMGMSRNVIPDMPPAAVNAVAMDVVWRSSVVLGISLSGQATLQVSGELYERCKI